MRGVRGSYSVVVKYLGEIAAGAPHWEWGGSTSEHATEEVRHQGHGTGSAGG
jgi:hypothetical protein